MNYVSLSLNDLLQNLDQICLLKTPRCPFPRQLRILAKDALLEIKNFSLGRLCCVTSRKYSSIHGHVNQSPCDHSPRDLLHRNWGMVGRVPDVKSGRDSVKDHLEIN